MSTKKIQNMPVFSGSLRLCLPEPFLRPECDWLWYLVYFKIRSFEHGSNWIIIGLLAPVFKTVMYEDSYMESFGKKRADNLVLVILFCL